MITVGLAINCLMLTPLDGIEVNALLNELPERAQLAEEVDSFLNSLEDVVNLAFGGKPSDAETNTAVGALVTVAEGSQDVAGFE